MAEAWQSDEELEPVDPAPSGGPRSRRMPFATSARGWLMLLLLLAATLWLGRLRRRRRRWGPALRARLRAFRSGLRDLAPRRRTTPRRPARSAPVVGAAEPVMALRRSGLRRTSRVRALRRPLGIAGLVAATVALSVATTRFTEEVVMPRLAPPRPAPTAAPAASPAPAEPPPAGLLLRTASALEPYVVTWPYEIVDGLTFGPEGAIRTRLAGLEGPGRDAVCNDRDGRPWACGLQARAALNNATRRQNLVCEPAPASAPDPVSARCRGETDIAREVVLAGFARPIVSDPVLDEAEGEARSAERGLWNGNWTIRIPAR